MDPFLDDKFSKPLANLIISLEKISDPWELEILEDMTLI